MADAAHMLSDFASLGISLAAIYLAERPVVKKYLFGYKRAEVIGALLIIVIIWVVTGVLLYLAIHRLRNGDYEVRRLVRISFTIHLCLPTFKYKHWSHTILTALQFF